MGAEQESIVREFMEAWGDGQQELPDVEKILSMFAEEIEWQLWMPGGPIIRGKAASRRDIERQMSWAKFMRCGPIHVASVGSVVFTERLDTIVVNGTTISHALVAVFELDEDGKIKAWREYFDTKDLDKQLAATRVSIPRVARD